MAGMVSYVLFFIILWFTWLQTTFYDIRFTNDSLYERVIRAIHFAVMVGFASVSTNWNPLDPSLPKASDNVMSMSLTLMGSRLALGIQYGVASIYAFKLLKKGIVPLLIHTVVMFGAAGAYLAVSEDSTSCGEIYLLGDSFTSFSKDLRGKILILHGMYVPALRIFANQC